MSWVGALGKVVIGTAAAAVAITALPVLGAAGAMSAAGMAVTGAIGVGYTGAAVADKLDEDARNNKK